MKRLTGWLLALALLLPCFAGHAEEGGKPAVGAFDFESKTVLLNSGYTMPILGLGTYALDHDTCVIPGSSNPEHIRENLDLFGFELTEEEMNSITELDRGEKHDWY